MERWRIKYWNDRFGTYFIDYDTIAPNNKRVDFSANASRKTKFRFELEENLTTRVDNLSMI
ncbi:MAG: hypothetical protein IPO48_07015 [Saprospiraceae bacterium]|nr:hypothetical protein [Saprospiraceae bacterium]